MTRPDGKGGDVPPFLAPGAARASAVLEDRAAQERFRSGLVNEEAARRLLELGMHPRVVAAWFRDRRRQR